MKGSGGSFNANLAAGRLLCDTYLSAKEFLRETTYRSAVLLVCSILTCIQLVCLVRLVCSSRFACGSFSHIDGFAASVPYL